MTSDNDKPPKGFVIYVIYKDPTDYPDKYVLRRWIGLKPDADPIAVTDTLKAARELVPPWCAQVSPTPEEKATSIEEIWL
jgi:hypothetical protein